MKKTKLEAEFDPQRIGIHYYPEGEHFGESDLQQWLPTLEELGVQWITLRAPKSRAIPEAFISGLIRSGITPIIHMPLSLEKPPLADEVLATLKAYANWGVHYVSFFDQPNARASWPNVGWTQRGLVARFLEIFTPIAKAALEIGLCPVFPPLEPGGDYWDTAFLRAALEELAATGETELIDGMALGAYAFSKGRKLDWGAGGPERWPGSIPYDTPEDSQDQRGFRIFDWYNAICRAAVGKELPILVMAAGHSRTSDDSQQSTAVKMAKQVALPLNAGFGKLLEVPANVIAFNLWLLAGDGDNATCAWFDQEGREKAPALEWFAWKAGLPPIDESQQSAENEAFFADTNDEALRDEEHYLLLPTYEWGKSNWHLKVIQPFVEKHRPVVGYSLSQARKAARVTIVGGSRLFTKDVITLLKDSGCEVAHIQGEGSEIAAQLAA